MKVKDEADLLRRNRIHNDWEIIGLGGWMVHYNSGAGERMPLYQGWNITCRGRHINAGNSWYDKKDSINVAGLHKASDKDKALAKATEMSGIKDWRRSPFGGTSYVSASVVKALIESLLERYQC